MGSGYRLKPGDRVDVLVGGSSFTATVEDLPDGNTVYIAPQQLEEQLHLPKQKQFLFLRSCSERGIITFKARVVEIDRSRIIPIIKVSISAEPRRVQRRNSFRVEVLLDVTIKKASEDEGQSPVSARALNISEDGMLFSSDQCYSEDERLICDIKLNKYGANTELKGVVAEVRRCELVEGRSPRTAVHFLNLSRADRDRLLRFIFLVQRKRINRD